MNEEEAEREIIQIAVDPNDVLQNELVLGIGTPPDANGGDAQEAIGGGDAQGANDNDDQPENIVRWTLSEKMKAKAYYKGFL